jgi:hypothetical protein
MRRIFRFTLSVCLICTDLILTAGNNISGNPEGIYTSIEKNIHPDSGFMPGHKSKVLSSLELKSPDGQIVFSFGIKNGYPSYSVSYKGKILVEDSRLSLRFKETG